MNIQTITLNNSYLLDNLLISSFKIILYKILKGKSTKKRNVSERLKTLPIIITPIREIRKKEIQIKTS